MADNRIYLKCKTCGKSLYLGKRLGFGYWWEDYGNGSLEKQLNEFYDKHYNCMCEGLDCFEIEYEEPPKEETTKERRTVALPLMWKEVKRDLPNLVGKILEDDSQMHGIKINFTARINEIPELTYTIERYAWEREKKE